MSQQRLWLELLLGLVGKSLRGFDRLVRIAKCLVDEREAVLVHVLELGRELLRFLHLPGGDVIAKAQLGERRLELLDLLRDR